MEQLDRHRYIEDYLPLAKAIAREIALKVPRAEASELFADAALALVRAFDAFDPTRGVSFKAFAQTWIRGYILNGVRNRNPVSERHSTLLRRSQEAWSQFAIEHERMPTSAELEVIVPGIARAMREAYERPAIPIEDEFASVAYKSPADAVLESERDSALHAAIASLPDRYREVIELACFEEMTISAIAVKWGRPRQYVAKMQTEARSMLRLRLPHLST